jgi:hypothetical protein
MNSRKEKRLKNMCSNEQTRRISMNPQRIIEGKVTNLHPTWFWLRYSAVAKVGGS